MKDYKEISDQELRDLLRQRLLHGKDESDLTQKTMDMEMKLAFNTHTLFIPSLEKEKELFTNLSSQTNYKKWWYLSAAIAIIISALILFNHFKKGPSPAHQKQVKTSKVEISIIIPGNEVKEENVPSKKKTFKLGATSLETDSGSTIEQVEQPIHIQERVMQGLVSKLPEDREEGNYIDVPTLSPKQIENNNKLKAKMVKQLVKKDAKSWSRIPMSTDVVNGDTVSVRSFYISTTEVTNQEYRVFLNDLIISERFDEYRVALPDTTKWLIENTGQYFEPMVKNYLWHPAYNDYPVVNISRKGADLFCKWLTESANKKIEKDNPKEKSSLYINDVRLPHDVEWIIAARGGLKAVGYPWGGSKVQNAKGCFLANFNIRKSEGKLDGPGDCVKPGSKAFTSAGTILGDGWSTAPVDGYSPNKFGLYNLSGNVAEMVWIGKTKESGTKGGSWNSDCEHLRIDAEDEYKGITEASPFIGFRPVFSE